MLRSPQRSHEIHFCRDIRRATPKQKCKLRNDFLSRLRQVFRHGKLSVDPRFMKKMVQPPRAIVPLLNLVKDPALTTTAKLRAASGRIHDRFLAFRILIVIQTDSPADFVPVRTYHRAELLPGTSDRFMDEVNLRTVKAGKISKEVVHAIKGDPVTRSNRAVR